MRSIGANFCYIILLSTTLNGCGTYVPQLNDYGDEQLFVQSIVTSVHCEIANAVKQYIDFDLNQRTGRRDIVAQEYYDNWGAEIALTLAVDDKSTVAPNAVGSPPSPASALFSIGGAISKSSESIRTDKANYFYTLRELYARAPCTAGIQPKQSAPSLIIQSDLGTASWLFDQSLPIYTKEVHLEKSAKGILKQNVLSHEVKFVVGTTGSLNPSFKLTRASVNQSGSLLSAGRDRTSDLIVTFGPLDKTQKNGALISQAESVHQIAQIGVANQVNLMNSPISLSLFP